MKKNQYTVTTIQAPFTPKTFLLFSLLVTLYNLIDHKFQP